MLDRSKATSLGTPAARYAIAVVAVGLAALLRWALDIYFGSSSPYTPYITFYLAITLAAIAGGVGPTLLATGLGAAVGLGCFAGPRRFGVVADAPGAVRLALYLATGAGSAVLSGWMHAARRHLIEQAQQASRNDERRRISEDRYRSLVQASAQAVWVASPTGEITDDLPSWRGFTGQDFEELRGWGWLNAVHPDDRERAAEAWRQAIRTRSLYQVEYRIRNAAGEYRHTLARAVPVLDDDGSVREWVGMNTDVTERRQAQAALRQSTERLNLAAEATGLGAFDFDPRTGELIWSERAKRHFGLGPDAHVDYEVFLRGLHPDDRQRVHAIVQNVLRPEGGGQYQIEYRTIGIEDGIERWLSATGQVFFDGAGQPVRFIGATFDITERKRAEEEVLASKKRLETFIEQAPVGLAMFDRQMRYVMVSDRWLEDLGLSGQSILGRSHYELFPNLPEHWKEAHRRGLAGESIGNEEDWVDDRGNPHTFRWVLHPWGDSGTTTGGIILYVEDITSRKRVEADLRKSEATLNAVLDSLPVGLIIAEADGRIVRMNKANSDLWGVPPETTSWEQYGDWVGYWAETGQRIKAHEWALARALRTGEAVRGDLVEVQQFGTGERRISLNNAAPVRDAQGNIIAGVVAQLDVTERIQAERRLRESERRLRTFFQADMVGTIYWAMDGRITDANDKFLQMVGYTREDLAGGKLQWAQMTPPEYRPLDEHALEELRTRGVDTPYEKEFIRKDGSRIPVIIGAAMLDEMRHEGVAFVLDITERKLAEEALRKNEQRLRATFNNAGVGIVEVEEDDRFIAVNHRICQILGRSCDELLKMNVHELTWPEDREVSDRLNRELHEGLRDRIDYEKRYMRGDGSPVWVHLIVSPIRDAQGRWTRSITTIEDITERKLAEEELAAAKFRAEEASRAKDHFLAVLSHELRTPLTPVLTTASMLEEDAALPAPVREDLGMIRRNIELEARLIDDLLDVTRIARGKIELHKQEVELRTILRQAVDVCRPDLEARQLDFGLDLGPDGPCIVDADPARLQQVFWNLLKNAIKFTPHGGCVGVRCRRENSQVITEVIDSGIGIEPEAMPHIFRPFEQGDRRITRQFGGLGLGLTISKAMIDLHGGRIEAHSAGKDRGATFRVILPLHQPAPRAEDRSAPTAGVQAVSSKLNILLVEDHGDTARMLGRLLKTRGHEVTHAGDVATALALARTRQFDVLVSDLGLPDASGHDLMRTLRQEGYNLAGIALSGYGMAEDVARSHEAGFVEHLTKPVNLEALGRALARARGNGESRVLGTES